MLKVSDQGFERLWGPSTIKPLNFNYEFQPTFVGQNIWTLTDDLFVPDRIQDDGAVVNSVANAKIRNSKGVQKRSSKYKQFPSIDQDIHQRSSYAQGSYVRRLTIGGSPGSSQHSQRPLYQTKDLKEVRKHEKEPGKFTKSQNDSLKPKLVQPKTLAKPKPASSPKFTLTKSPPQSRLTLKLSQQETEILLKSLDFKVRRKRKTKPRDRSKSEALDRPKKVQTAYKRLSMNKVEPRKPLTIKKSDLKQRNLENQELLKSSQMSSSSGKNSRSSSGLDELVGPLPRVNAISTHEPIQPKKSSSASLKKKSSEKSGAALSKGSKTSSSSKKVGKHQSDSEDVSREPSSEGTSLQQKVKTTRVKIIPKLTLNNQLLKSTTAKAESKQPQKGAPKKKDPKQKPETLWTPEKLALLDQITNDQQLKAVLISAADTYMKTRKYFAVKSYVKTKPTRQTSSTKKDPLETKKIAAATKPSITAATPKKAIKGHVDEKSASKEEKPMANLDQSASPPSNPEAGQIKPEGDQPGKKSEVINSQLLKTDGAPKTAKTPKSPSRKVVNPSAKDNKKMNFVAANKKRPKYTIDSRQVRKVEERLAQLSAEVTVNSMKMQDKKVSQVQRSNLDHLRKVVEKSIANFKEDAKPGEMKSN